MVHSYKAFGYNIALDVDSGGVHILDDMAYELLPALGEALEAGAPEAELISMLALKDADKEETLNELLKLYEQGRLFSTDDYEAQVKAFTARKSCVKAMCLHVAHACNLACKYCFAGKGEYSGPAGLMPFEVGKQALDYLVENSKAHRNLEVDFFGGEPLLNWDVVKALVEYGRSIEAEHNKNFRFTLTTNGTLLTDEILEYANKEMSNLVLSIDGREEVHDKMRPYRDGRGSYKEIVPKYIKAAESRGQTNYYVRGTYTRYNKDFAKDVLALADLGFKQISVEPVVAPLSEPYALREEDVPELLEQYDILTEEMIKRKREGKDFNFFHFMIDLEGGPCVYKRLSGCGAGCEYVAVTPFGDIYPCHQFVGETDYKLGSVSEGIVRPELVQKFHNCNVYSRPSCRDCFAKYYCSGGCMANAKHFSGSIDGSYEIGCKLQRKRVECAIALKAAEADMEE